jgi:hypothetical protein
MPDTFDASSFLKGLDLADRRVRAGGVRGMAMLLGRGEQRSKELVPVDTGTLAGTIVGDVQGIRADEKLIEGTLTAGGGEASDYAVRQHEEPLEHTHPEDGVYASKYIERPLKEISGIAASVMAAEIRKELA